MYRAQITGLTEEKQVLNARLSAEREESEVRVKREQELTEQLQEGKETITRLEEKLAQLTAQIIDVEEDRDKR